MEGAPSARGKISDRSIPVEWVRGDNVSLPRLPLHEEADPELEEVMSWEQYVENLNGWEYELMKNTTQTSDSSELIDILKDEQATLWIVSNGGAQPPELKYRAFGWVIHEEGGETLWENNGMAWGYLCTSFRAESFGRLSAMCFLWHYVTFFEMLEEVECNCQYWTDCKLLLSSLKTF